MEKRINPKNKSIKSKDKTIKRLKIYETAVRESLAGFALFKLIFDENKKIADLEFIEINESFYEIFHKGAADTIGKSISVIFTDLDPGTDFWNHALPGLIKLKKPITLDYYLKPSNRRLMLQLILNGNRTVIMHIFDRVSASALLTETTSDITQVDKSKKYQKEEPNLSSHDKLTGLYNRRFYEEELKHRNTEDNLPTSLIIAELNGLKLIKDAFGHAQGDKMLTAFAVMIKQVCRADDVIARIGEEEFVILLPKTYSLQAEKIVERIKTVINKSPIGKVMLSVSFGYKTKYTLKEEFEDIYRLAEVTMCLNKLIDENNYKKDLIDIITKSLYEKSPREQVHSERVSMICKNIGRVMGMSTEEITRLGLMGIFHDIGKIRISGKLLNKPGKLNEEEWIEMKRHPEIGYHLLRCVNEYADIAEYVLAHHERLDGIGYPKGLQSDEIPVNAKILQIAEAFDDMTGNNGFRKPLSIKEAVCELKKYAGIQFDREIVSVFTTKVLMEE